MVILSKDAALVNAVVLYPPQYPDPSPAPISILLSSFFNLVLNSAADVQAQDPGSLDTALHCMAAVKDFDSRAAFIVHEADPGKMVIMKKNGQELTPFAVRSCSCTYFCVRSVILSYLLKLDAA